MDTSFASSSMKVTTLPELRWMWAENGSSSFNSRSVVKSRGTITSTCEALFSSTSCANAAYTSDEGESRSSEDCFPPTNFQFRRCVALGGRMRTKCRPLLVIVMQALATAPVRMRPFSSSLVKYSPCCSFSTYFLTKRSRCSGVMGLPFEVVHLCVARLKAAQISGVLKIVSYS